MPRDGASGCVLATPCILTRDLASRLPKAIGTVTF